MRTLPAARRSARAHACSVDTHVDAFLGRVFKGVPMALRAAKGDEDALVARAFSRPCRHSCRHVFSRVFKGPA